MRHWRHKNLYWNFVTKQWEWLKKKNPTIHMCITRGCQNPAELRWERGPNKTRVLKRRPCCSKCTRRRWRYNNPLYYMFCELKLSAKKRGLYFDLHYGEFIEFCFDNDFYRMSPKFTRDSLTIDRVDDNLGYTIHNIHVITNSENVIKGNNRRKNRYTQPIDEPF